MKSDERDRALSFYSQIPIPMHAKLLSAIAKSLRATVSKRNPLFCAIPTYSFRAHVVTLADNMT